MNTKTGELTVTGYVEPTKILKILAKKGIEVVRLKLPSLLAEKEVVLNGCHVGRDDPVELPSDLTCLRIFECHNLRSLSDISSFQQTNELSSCLIVACRGMESVLDLSSSSSSSSSSSRCTPFQNLEFLRLEKLDNLHMPVSRSSLMPLPGIFSHLKSFYIEGCSNMKKLFPFELGHDLQNLENLEISNCVQMEEIIASEEKDENYKRKETYSSSNTMFSFPKLRKLALNYLPALKSICSLDMVMTCDSLRNIEIRGCWNLKRMPLYLPLFQGTDQQLHSHAFRRIIVRPKQWWKSVEWDHPNAKNVLLPWLQNN